ncbi:fatty acyl-CoA reductase wat-like [Diaphorina citri]|uniref:Fatty acyl-CoA reductase wat-like n=1 Tax=Diaphorina citri TaxID=121845 RepID=A0A3Q0JE81_DIACI|nr:fatty acyl-CoA reductase wat-like [Diaphorina citri]
MGVGLAAGIGLMRVSLIDTTIVIDIVPGDRTINAMTALAWYHSTQQPNKDRPTVFNYVSYNDNRVRLIDFIKKNRRYAILAEESSQCRMWPPSIYFVSNTFLYRILFLVLHLTPAIMFSLVERWYNRKPQIMKFYRKIKFFNKTIEHFATNEWHFTNNNTRAMVNEMSKADRKRFDASLDFRWESMFVHLYRATVLYFLNERFTKEYHQKKFIYKERLNFCISWIIYVSAAYWFLTLLANLINTLV